MIPVSRSIESLAVSPLFIITIQRAAGEDGVYEELEHWLARPLRLLYNCAWYSTIHNPCTNAASWRSIGWRGWQGLDSNANNEYLSTSYSLNAAHGSRAGRLGAACVSPSRKQLYERPDGAYAGDLIICEPANGISRGLLHATPADRDQSPVIYGISPPDPERSSYERRDVLDWRSWEAGLGERLREPLHPSAFSRPAAGRATQA